MDLEKIEKLIKMVNSSGLSEFKLEEGNMKIKLVNQTKVVNAEIPIAKASVDQPPNEALAPTANCQLSTDYCYITSPLVGVFKPLSASDKTPVKVGDIVSIGQPVCVVEAMKLINEIEADKAGEIVEILVNEGDSVEYGQQLIKLK